jgi:RNA-directed DNA polymerase
MHRPQTISKAQETSTSKTRLEIGRTKRGQSTVVRSPEKKDDRSETCTLMEEILSKQNMTIAYKRVKANKGSGGIDGMTVDELKPYLDDAWPFLKAEILDGSYKPAAVKCVMIPKPSGGERMLGIPTVVDRLIQQAIAQALTRIYDAEFSESSFGFRPGRKAHDAVRQAQRFINEGHRYVIDIDLEKFFDHVHHDRLMSRLSVKVKDKRVLKLIRTYLKTGIMMNGLTEPRTEGTPQGSPLSPILSNIVLDELDKELEKRGHKFCRYADDSSIYVRSRKAGERVMTSITRYITGTLKLKVNAEKSSVREPEEMKLLGFTFYRSSEEYHIGIALKSIHALKAKIKKLTGRKYSISVTERLRRLGQLMMGWMSYFKLGGYSTALKIDQWTRFRLRMCIWKTWRRVRTRVKMLVKLGVSKKQALQWANTRKGYCRVALSPILSQSLTNAYFRQAGYVEIGKAYTR